MWQMGLAGIEMIGRHPIEPGAEVGFHLPHQVADEWFEVGDFPRVLRCHDEAKLVAIAFTSLSESLGIGAIVTFIVELAGITLARDAVALDVAQMGLHLARIACVDADDPSLDDDPALTCGATACGDGSLRIAAADT
jgi:hypothetical protein